MNVLLVALELAPYYELSPAAEAVSGLAKALRLLGHEVVVLVPRAPAYEQGGLLYARQLSPLNLGEGAEAVLFDAVLSSGVKLVLADLGEPGKDPRPTEAEFLGAFASTVRAYVEKQSLQGTPFDVVHCHDAGAGLALFKLEGAQAEVPGRVLTVHDADRAGQFPLTKQSALGIPDDRTGPQGFGSGDGLCLLKGLVGASDVILAPSEAYCRALKAPERHGALARAFQGANLVGVREGVDHAVFNPATDAALVSRYDSPHPENKGRNKQKVLSELGLDFDITRPVVLVEQGPLDSSLLDVFLHALPKMLRNELTVLFCAKAPQTKEEEELFAPLSKQFCWLTDPAPHRRRRLLAASDFYLSIDKKDPSGQRLLKAARYGAIPVAPRVDSVPDVVVDCDSELHTGTGLLFESVTQRNLVSVSARITSAYRSEGYLRLLSRVMRQDLGWERAARRHVQIYRQTLTG